MVTGQKITSNTTWYLLALIIQKLFSFIYFTLLARHLGPTHYGQYQLALSFAMMLSVISDFGLSAVLIREIAKKQIDEHRLFSQIFSLKLILGLLTAIIIIGLDWLLYANNIVRPLIYLTTLIVIIDSFTLTFYGFIRGRQNLFYESIGTMLFQLIIMIAGLLVMRFNSQLYPFILVILSASTFNLIFSAYLLFKKYHLRLKLYLDRPFVKEIFLITWPFALSAVFAKIYAYIDSLLLEGMRGATQLGYYSVAYKITFAFQFIPLAFVAALYPALSHYWQNDKDRLAQALTKAIHYLSFIAWPIALGITSLGGVIITKLYTVHYLNSILPLQILILSLPFLFVNFALSYFLNATDRQIINTRNLGLVMLSNIILNLFLLKSWGAVGASLASSLSTILLFILNLTAVCQVIKLGFSVWRPVLLSIIAAGLMALLVWSMSDLVSVFINIALAIITYLLLMIIFGNIGKADWQYLKSALKKRGGDA
ncbi:MAG: flippase [Patescibacteria group bacterium]